MNHLLVAIVAIGDERRAGIPKLCLPWARTTILGHVINRWCEAGASEILVVHGSGALSVVTQELDRLGIPDDQRVANLASGRGSMGAIVTAARSAMQKPDLTHLLVTRGDQPQVRTATLESLLGACHLAPGQLIRPVFRGKAGYPCALPVEILPDLIACDADTLDEFIDAQALPVTEVACHDSGILFDMDASADLCRAHQSALAPLTQPILT